MTSNDLKCELYSGFTKSSDFSNRTYMANAYGVSRAPQVAQPKLQYYNDEVELSNKRKKRARIGYIGLAVASVAAALSALIATKKINISKTAQTVKNLQLGDKLVDFLVNANNIKDVYWKKFTDKVEHTPLFFLKKGGEKYTDLYRTTQKKFNPYAQKFKDAYKKVIEAGGNAQNVKGLQDYSTWFDEANTSILKEFDGKDACLTNGIFKDGIFGKKGLLKRMTNEIIADGRLEKYKEKAAEALVAAEGSTPELAKAVEELNAVKKDATALIFPKLRDINLGQAPTDFINQIFLPTAFLGVAVANSKTKEEKKDTLLNLGVPILTTLGFTQVANMRSLSGAKALLFGLATGELVTFGLKGLSKLREKNKEKLAQLGIKSGA